MAQHEGGGAILAHSSSLRCAIGTVNWLLSLRICLNFWREMRAAAEVEQAHPGPQPALSLAMLNELVRQRALAGAQGGQQGRGEGNQGQEPGTAPATALDRCRALLTQLAQPVQPLSPQYNPLPMEAEFIVAPLGFGAPPPADGVEQQAAAQAAGAGAAVAGGEAGPAAEAAEPGAASAVAPTEPPLSPQAAESLLGQLQQLSKGSQPCEALIMLLLSSRRTGTVSGGARLAWRACVLLGTLACGRFPCLPLVAPALAVLMHVPLRMWCLHCRPRLAVGT